MTPRLGVAKAPQTSPIAKCARLLRVSFRFVSSRHLGILGMADEPIEPIEDEQANAGARFKLEQSSTQNYRQQQQQPPKQPARGSKPMDRSDSRI